MATEPFIVPSSNLSESWARVFLRLLEHGVTDLAPAVVIVSQFGNDGPREIPAIRERLDAELGARGKRSVHTLANTIFPETLWQPDAPNNDAVLYARYERVWPRIQKDTANRRGVYFRRLTAYRPSRYPNSEPVNQLQRLIETYRRSHRRSALQAGIFDPTGDHRNEPFLGFPCLQQIAFAPLGRDALGMTAFYAMQYQFEKAYGNYLGLCRLGRFVATQLGRRLTRMTCIASIAKLGDNLTKATFAPFATDLRTIIADRNEERRVP